MARRLGQHFLVRQSVLQKIAEAACGEHVSRLIEIGPGRGALTKHLLTRTDELHVIELDTPLAEYLRREFISEAKLHVHEADVLEVDLSQWGAAAIAGNLPYYITSPIIRKFLELDERFQTAVFLVQSEVAERLIAIPGTRDYGFLTVMAQLICEVKLVCHVPAVAFSPPPKVDSAAVRLIRRPIQPSDLSDLLTFVARCFTQKRKTLRNNLRPFYGPVIDSLPEAGLRAEQIPVAEFHALLKRVKSMARADPPVH